MSLRGFLTELRRRHVVKVAVAYTGIGIVLLEVLTHLFHNFEAPHWVLKVITTLLIVGLPVACLMAWGFEFRGGRVRSIPREPTDAPPALPSPDAATPHPSIAVLPFADMSAEHDQQYLGDGIADRPCRGVQGAGRVRRRNRLVVARRRSARSVLAHMDAHTEPRSPDHRQAPTLPRIAQAHGADAGHGGRREVGGPGHCRGQDRIPWRSA